MSARFEQAELLKKQYTDKFVVVKANVAELRRFTGLTGVVKTVNMSGRALVLFDGPADIGWYDIDPAFLTVVDSPLPKPAASEAKPAKESPAAKTAPVAKAAPAAAAKKASPLDMIRKQGAAGAKSEAPTSPAASSTTAAPAASAPKLSPLDMVRKQAAAKAGGGASAPTASSEGKRLSPIEMIRQQQGIKSAATAPAPVIAEAAPVVAAPAPAVAEEAPAIVETPKPAAPATDGKKLSTMELIRQQGAFKGK
ncbi:MAG: hypothetical protein ACKV2Q_27890 [Planctomycetaceae bacterium]